MDDIPILWRDEHLLVVAKPSRVLVVSAPGRKSRTIADIVGKQIGQRVYAVHRLDEDVTGVLALALHQSSKPDIEAVFRNHEARRIYLALLSRAPDPAAGRIESRLREGKDGVVRSVTSGPGDLAITEFQTLRRDSRYTLVECRLQTGRRNQIRAHMADLSCPIVGDRKYGFRVRGGPSFPRPLLHAEQLQFDHPLTGEPIHVATPAPEPELHR